MPTGGETTPRRLKKAGRGLLFFKWPALICLGYASRGLQQMNRPQFGFFKPALGCLFHKAGPGLPRNRQPGDDEGGGNDPKATQKSRPWAAFLNGRPWFAWRQATRDHDKRKLTPRRLQKAGVGLPFYKAGPGLPRDMQPGWLGTTTLLQHDTRHATATATRRTAVRDLTRPGTSRSALRRRGRAARVMPARH